MKLVFGFAFLTALSLFIPNESESKIFWPPKHREYFQEQIPKIRHSHSKYLHPAFRTQFNLTDEIHSDRIIGISQSFRLPENVKPIHYSIAIVPLLDNGTSWGSQWTAPGSVNISIECVQSTKVVTLHALRLEILDVKVSNR